jgi:hypothetical protein
VNDLRFHRDPTPECAAGARPVRRITSFGRFRSSNFGAESTLRAMPHNLRRFQPHANAVCISSGPAAAAATCVNRPELAAGRDEIYGRSCEGAAAGAVMIGEPPRKSSGFRCIGAGDSSGPRSFGPGWNTK